MLTDGPYEAIGRSGVAVPKQFYKVVLDYTNPDVKAIGFVLPNEGSEKSLQSFAMTVDEVEAITGLDFYPALPDEEEATIESRMSTADWNFTEFIPTGEAPDPEALEYIAPKSSMADKVLDAALHVFVDIKEEIFSMLGITDIARAIGLV